jgi:hypothetical protein
VRAIRSFRSTGRWADGPAEGIDAWNARMRAAGRDEAPTAALARFDEGRARLEAALATLAEADVRSPEGWGWVYECLHGHVRAHLAMVGPWCGRVGWPAADRR